MEIRLDKITDEPFYWQEKLTIPVETLSRPLMALAYRYTRDWEWARDLTQETWVKVHEHIGRYEKARSFTSWLYAIHRNGCRDHLRRPWVQQERTPGEETRGLRPFAASPSFRRGSSRT